MASVIFSTRYRMRNNLKINLAVVLTLQDPQSLQKNPSLIVLAQAIMCF